MKFSSTLSQFLLFVIGQTNSSSYVIMNLSSDDRTPLTFLELVQEIHFPRSCISLLHYVAYSQYMYKENRYHYMHLLQQYILLWMWQVRQVTILTSSWTVSRWQYSTDFLEHVQEIHLAFETSCICCVQPCMEASMSFNIYCNTII